MSQGLLTTPQQSNGLGIPTINEEVFESRSDSMGESHLVVQITNKDQKKENQKNENNVNNLMIKDENKEYKLTISKPQEDEDDDEEPLRLSTQKAPSRYLSKTPDRVPKIRFHNDIQGLKNENPSTNDSRLFKKKNLLSRAQTKQRILKPIREGKKKSVSRLDVIKRMSVLVHEKHSDVNTLIKLNLDFKVIASSPEQMNDFCTGHLVVAKDRLKFKKGQFDWKMCGYFDERDMLTMIYTSLEDFKGMALLHVKPFLEVFPLTLIDQYVRSPFIQTNYQVYDVGIRFISMLLIGLLKFYLMYDLRFWTRCHIRDAQSLDPFYRQKLRNRIKKDEFLNKRYLTGDFKIKELIKFGIKYFPGLITRNRLSTGMDVVELIIHILSVTLSYGFWDVNELDELVNLINMNLTLFIKLEEMVEDYGSKLSTKEIQDVTTSLRLIRRFMTVSLTQVILYANDIFFLSKFTQIGDCYLPDPLTSSWNSYKLFFDNSQLIKDISGILLNYLLRDNKVLGEVIIQKIERDYLRKLADFVFHVDREPFALSLEYIDEHDTMLYRMNQADMDRLGADALKAVAELNQLIDDVSLGEYKESQLSTNVEFTRRLIKILDNLYKLAECEEGEDDEDFLEESFNPGEKELIDNQMLKKKLAKESDPLLKKISSRRTLLAMMKSGSSKKLLQKSYSKMIDEYVDKKLVSRFIFSERKIPELFITLIDFISLQSIREDIMEKVIKLIGMLGNTLDQVHVDIFTADSWYHLSSYFQRSPVHFTKLLLELTKGTERLFHISPRFFYLIFDLFCQSVEKYSKGWELHAREEVNLDDLISLSNLSLIVETVIDCVPEKWNRQPFDLSVSTVLEPLILDSILPAIRDPNLIDYDIVEFPMETDPKFNYNESDLDNMSYESAEDEFIMHNINLMFKMLKLFNKSTREVYSNKTYLKMRKEVWYDKLQDYDFLCDSVAGILIRKQVLICFRNFLIFHFNHIISDRQPHTAASRLMDHELPQIYGQGIACDMIVNEVELLERIYSSADKFSKNESIKLIFTEYICDGPLSLVYKYIRGICFTCHDENIIKEFFVQLNDISEVLANHYNRICDVFTKNTEKGEEKFDKVYKVLMLFSLKKKTPVQSKKDKFTFVKKGGGIRGNQKHKTSSGVQGEAGNKIFSRTLKNRSQTLQEKIRDDLVHHSINSFRSQIGRIEASVRNLFKLAYGNRHDQDLYFSKRSDNLRENSKFRSINDRGDPTIILDADLKLKLTTENVEKFRSSYKGAKDKFLSKRDNFIHKILGSAGERSSDYRRLINFLCYEFNEMSVLIRTENSESSYWTQDRYITRIEMLNSLISCSKGCKQFFYQWCLENPEGLTKLFYVLIQLMLMSVHKTFFCHRWAEYKTDFLIVRQFFQNMKEDNYMPFKQLFGDHKPDHEVEGWPFNIERQTYVNIYNIQVQKIINLTKLWTNMNVTILDSDRPEIFDTMANLLEGVNEFITGPCQVNQRSLFNQKRLEILITILFRDILDISSDFYLVIDQIVNQLLCFTEGEDVDRLMSLARMISPLKVFSRMIHLVRNLYFKRTTPKDNRLHRMLEIYSTQKVTGKRDLEAQIIFQASKSYKYDINLKSMEDLKNLYLRDEGFSENIILSIAAKLYFLMKNIALKSDNYRQFLIEREVERKKSNISGAETEEVMIHSFMDHITSSVELVQEQGNSIQAYFVLRPETFFLTNSTKKQFFVDANIDSVVSLLDDFIKRYRLFKVEMVRGHLSYKSSPLIHWFGNRDAYKVYVWSVYFLGLFLNIYITSRFDSAHPDLFSGDTMSTVVILNISIIVLSFLILVFWFATKFKTSALTRLQHYKNQNEGKIPRTLVDKVRVYFIEALAYDRIIISLLVHIVLGVLSFSNPFFITLHLMLILNLSSTMRNVMSAIIIHIDQLAQTFIFVIVTIYAFAMITVQSYKNDFDKGMTSGVDVCQSLYSCVMQMIDLGLRFGGGIAEAMTLKDVNNSEFLLKWSFNLLFFILINVVFLNVVFGIIIDTFAELRDNETERSQFMKNKCFVCGLDRTEFERNGKNFDKHKSDEHDIWKYLSYLLYLDIKPYDEFNGDELYVWDSFLEGSTVWIPQNFTMYLRKKEDNSEIHKTKNYLKESIDNMKNEILEHMNKSNYKLEMRLNKLYSIVYAKQALNEEDDSHSQGH